MSEQPNIDGSRLLSLSDRELEQLLDMRVADLRKYRQDYGSYECTGNVFRYLMRIHEVTNAMLDCGRRQHNIRFPLFIPTLNKK